MEVDPRSIYLEVRRGRSGKPELVVHRQRAQAPHSIQARASAPGGSARFFDGFNGTGDNFTRSHGESVTNLATVPTGCFIICWGSFDNKISSVETNGSITRLFSEPFFMGVEVRIGTEWERRTWNMSDMGFNDTASSLWVD